MKHALQLTLTSLMTTLLWTGCTGQISSTPTPIDATKQAQQCAALNQKLETVEDYITKIQGMSTVHAEEIGETLTTPQITESTNKKRMLRDANTRRNTLLKEQQALGCTPSKK